MTTVTTLAPNQTEGFSSHAIANGDVDITVVL